MVMEQSHKFPGLCPLFILAEWEMDKVCFYRAQPLCWCNKDVLSFTGIWEHAKTFETFSLIWRAVYNREPCFGYLIEAPACLWAVFRWKPCDTHQTFSDWDIINKANSQWLYWQLGEYILNVKRIMTWKEKQNNFKIKLKKLQVCL